MKVKPLLGMLSTSAGALGVAERLSCSAQGEEVHREGYHGLFFIGARFCDHDSSGYEGIAPPHSLATILIEQVVAVEEVEEEARRDAAPCDSRRR